MSLPEFGKRKLRVADNSFGMPRATINEAYFSVRLDKFILLQNWLNHVQGGIELTLKDFELPTNGQRCKPDHPVKLLLEAIGVSNFNRRHRNIQITTVEYLKRETLEQLRQKSPLLGCFGFAWIYHLKTYNSKTIASVTKYSELIAKKCTKAYDKWFADNPKYRYKYLFYALRGIVQKYFGRRLEWDTILENVMVPTEDVLEFYLRAQILIYMDIARKELIKSKATKQPVFCLRAAGRYFDKMVDYESSSTSSSPLSMVSVKVSENRKLKYQQKRCKKNKILKQEAQPCKTLPKRACTMKVRNYQDTSNSEDSDQNYSIDTDGHGKIEPTLLSKKGKLFHKQKPTIHANTIPESYEAPTSTQENYHVHEVPRVIQENQNLELNTEVITIDDDNIEINILTSIVNTKESKETAADDYAATMKTQTSYEVPTSTQENNHVHEVPRVIQVHQNLQLNTEVIAIDDDNIEIDIFRNIVKTVENKETATDDNDVTNQIFDTLMNTTSLEVWTEDKDKLLIQFILKTSSNLQCDSTYDKLLKEHPAIFQDVTSEMLKNRTNSLASVKNYFYLSKLCGCDKIQNEKQKCLFFERIENLRNLMRFIPKIELCD